MCLSVCLFVFVRLFVCLSVCLFVFVRLFVCPFVCLFVRLFECLCVTAVSVLRATRADSNSAV